MTGALPDFAAARAVPILSVLERRGVKLKRAGTEWRGVCPLCHHGARSRSNPFSASAIKNLFKCHSCGEGGDVVQLERLMGGGTPADAARRLTGPVAAPLALVRSARSAHPAPDLRRNDSAWRRILHQSRPAAGTIVESWLGARGVSARWARDLLFHPSAPAGPGVIAPAMVAVVTRAGCGRANPDAITGLHLTYLSADGEAKADLPPDCPARRMYGGVKGGAVWIGAGRLALSTTPRLLVVGEGIESTLSLLEAVFPAHAHSPLGAAVLSLDNLQGGWLADRLGARNVDTPVADHAHPPFVVPDWPGPVMIGVDHDMRPITVLARNGRGLAAHRTLDHAARARICASLALQHWRAAGIADVTAVAPRAGLDFNDAWRDRA